MRLSFSNSTTSGNNLREQTQQFLQQTFAEIGVEMTISNLPAAVMWGDFWLKSQFDTAMSGVTYLIAADPDATNRLHTKAIAAQGGHGSNTAQYSNPEVDALLDKGARSFDPEERRGIYNRVQEVVRHDLPFLPLFAYTNVLGRKKGLDGFEPNRQHAHRVVACRGLAVEGLNPRRCRRPISPRRRQQTEIVNPQRRTRMRGFLLNRLSQSLVLLVIVSIIGFGILNLLPGRPDGAIRARSRDDPAGYRAAQGAAGP